MTDELESAEPDAGLSSKIIDQIFELWVSPELARRGLELTRRDISKVLVEIDPDQALRVLINDEAILTANFVANRDIAAGEAVMLDDIESLSNLQPQHVGPNSGWICFIRLGEKEFIAFDFTYNRARASMLIERAREFLGAASYAASGSATNVALDNAHSAAELTVQAQMLVLQHETQSHYERRKWLADWARNQNSPQQHADVLWNLATLRDKARYGSDEVALKPGRLATIIVTVGEMIEAASARVEKEL